MATARSVIKSAGSSARHGRLLDGRLSSPRLRSPGTRYSPDLTGYEDWLLYRELTAAGEVGYRDPRDTVELPGAKRIDARDRGEAGDRLLAELRAHVREREVAWTPSNG